MMHGPTNVKSVWNSTESFQTLLALPNDRRVTLPMRPKRYEVLHVNCPLLLAGFTKMCNVSTNFPKTSQCQMSRYSTDLELLQAVIQTRGC